ncbi:MAG: hypothetical protein ACYSWP_04825 [Planctomycetota bacterium]
MNRRIISILSLIVVLALTWACFAAPETPTAETSTSTRSSRRGQWRERQQKALSAIEAQLAKIKTSMESSPRGRSRGRDLSEEERNKLREQYRKVREERMKSMVLIEDQMLLLKGRRTVYQDYDKSMGQLNGLLESAKKEKAKETTAAIEKIIAAKKLEFEKRMKKLGMEERPRSRGSRSRSN